MAQKHTQTIFRHTTFAIPENCCNGNDTIRQEQLYPFIQEKGKKLENLTCGKTLEILAQVTFL